MTDEERRRNGQPHGAVLIATFVAVIISISWWIYQAANYQAEL